MSGDFPTIRVLAPTSGEAVPNPFGLSYEVTGFELGSPPRGHIHVIWGDDPAVDFVPVNVDEQQGRILVEGVPDGTHDLMIALANADGTLVDAQDASLVLGDVTVGAQSPTERTVNDADPGSLAQAAAQEAGLTYSSTRSLEAAASRAASVVKMNGGDYIEGSLAISGDEICVTIRLGEVLSTGCAPLRR